MMSLYSQPNIYRIFPLMFGIVSLIGYILKKLFIFDTGIFFTVISYLFANSGLSPTFSNLLLIMVFFFLFIGIWFYARGILFISGVKGVGSDKYDIGLSEFRRSSLSEVLSTILIGVLLSILASFLVLYSSLDITLGSLTETLLLVGLSVSVFFITFLVIKLFSLENVKTGEEA